MRTSISFHRTVLTLIRLLLAGLLLTAWAGLPRSSYSAPEATVRYVAPGGSDSYPCTTAAKPCEHIQVAIDKSASGDTIQIAPGTYIEQLAIRDRNLTLTGKSAANTFLDGNQLYQILSISRESTPSMTVSLSGVTLRNGKSTQPGGAIANDSNSYLTISNSSIINNSSSNGGGIFNNGFLKLINVTVSDNSATSLEGGGIYNAGYIELNGVLLADNQAPSGGGISNRNAMTITASSIVSNISNGGNDGGGGIYNVASSSKLILLNSTLSGNKSLANAGAAIFNRGIVTGTATTILGNEADYGGGIYNDISGRATFSSGSIRGNTAVFDGGGFFNGGIARIDKGLITGNRAVTKGGGIHNSATGKLTVGTSIIITNTTLGAQGGGISNLGALTVTQSALVYNTSSTSQGGGLSNAGTTRLTNVTISYNAALSGAGIYNSGGTLSLQFSTVANNGSPALNNAGGTVTVGNSILAQSAGGACSGTIISAGYNMDTDTSCGFIAAGDLSNKDPQLGPLQDNGGGTLTRAIAFSSLAVDNAGACPPPNADQRGVVRPQAIQLPKCDRGAYEVVGYANNNGLDIGPSQCVNSSLTINEKFAIGRMLAGVNLTYSGSRTNLTIRLLSPGITKVTLLGPAANSGRNLDTMFDDSASSIVPAGDQDPAAPYYNPSYKPSTPLSQVRGIGINGTWRLEICNTGTVRATLNRWVLVVPETTDFKVYMPIIKRN
jgi:hypothetical protein